MMFMLHQNTSDDFRTARYYTRSEAGTFSSVRVTAEPEVNQYVDEKRKFWIEYYL